MSITETEIETIARLARVPLTPEEVERTARDLGAILQRIETLDALELDAVAPLERIDSTPVRLREDRPGGVPLAEPLAEIAPAWEEGFFVVPRIAALDAAGRAALEEEEG